MNRTALIAVLVWFLPVILLLLSLFPLPFPGFYGLLVQIVVSVAAAYIVYLLFTTKPKYYLIWGIAFIAIVLIYNPIIAIPVLVKIAVPLSVITALVFLANWWLVFRSRYSFR